MRMPLDQINVLGRVTQGVRLINLREENSVATVSIVDKEKEKDEEDNQQSVDLGNNQVEEVSNNEGLEDNQVINKEDNSIIDLANELIEEASDDDSNDELDENEI